jgi:glycosyltransferase involved in cell wall biosynthesis
VGVPVEDLRIMLWFWGRRGGGAQYTCAVAEGLKSIDGIRLSASVSKRMESLDRLRVSVPQANLVCLDRSVRSFPLLAPGPTSFGAQVRRESVDVVLHTMANPLTAWAWPGGGPPIVSVIHDAVPHHGDTAGLIDRGSRYAQRHSNLLVAPSNGVADVLRHRWPRAAIETIPLPSHVSLPDLWDANGDVLFFGRIVPYKGLELLVEAWRRIAHPKARLRICGEPLGDQKIIQQLRETGADVDLRWIPDSEISTVLHGVRLIVLPYVEASQSGVITLAKSAGIPVLVTNVGALPDQAGKMGLVVEPTIEGIATGLSDLLSSPSPHLRRLRDEAVHQRASIIATDREIADQFAVVLRNVFRNQYRR